MADTEGPPPPSPPARRRQDFPKFLVLLSGVVGLLVLSILIFLPFVAPIVLALGLSTAAYPLFLTILRWVGMTRRGLASFLTCFALVLLVFVPLVWLGWSLINQAPGAVEQVRNGIQSLEDRVDKLSFVNSNPQVKASWDRTKRMLDWIQGEGEPGDGNGAAPQTPPREPGNEERPPATDRRSPDDPERVAGQGPRGDDGGAARTGAGGQSLSGDLVSWLWTSASTILSNLFELGVKFVVMLYILFFFFKDGPRIALSLKRAVPLEDVYEERIWRTFREMSRSIIRGSFGTAAIQGVIAGIAFAIVGIPAVFWGVATALASLIPPLGTALVLVPATLYQFFSAEGSIGKGIFLAVVTGLVGLLDNIVRPYLMGGGVKVHEIWLLLSILGGLNFFGPMGLIYGPMVLVFLGTFVRLFVEEERQSQTPPSQASPPPTVPPCPA